MPHFVAAQASRCVRAPRDLHRETNVPEARRVPVGQGSQDHRMHGEPLDGHSGPPGVSPGYVPIALSDRNVPKVSARLAVHPSLESVQRDARIRMV